MKSEKKSMENEESKSNLDAIERRLKSVEKSLENLAEITREMRNQLLDKNKEEKGWFYAGILISGLFGLVGGL